MNSLAALLTPLALLLPGFGGEPGQVEKQQLTAEHGVQRAGDGQASASAQAPTWFELTTPYRVPTFNQVRIERRIILRISPRPTPLRQDLAASFNRERAATRYLERPIGECLPMNAILAVQPAGGSRLVLYLRDRRLISARLEKACSARDFYSGFLVERSEDGQLCIERDRLQARSGAKCQLSSINQLVAVTE